VSPWWVRSAGTRLACGGLLAVFGGWLVMPSSLLIAALPPTACPRCTRLISGLRTLNECKRQLATSLIKQRCQQGSWCDEVQGRAQRVTVASWKLVRASLPQSAHRDKPAIQFGDSDGTPNLVGQKALGQCGFKVILPSPAPEAHIPVKVKHLHISLPLRHHD